MVASSSDAMWKTLVMASPCVQSAGLSVTSWPGVVGTFSPSAAWTLWDTPAGVQTMTEVLPQAFGVDNLDRVANQQEKS